MSGVRDAAMTTGRESMMLVINEGESFPPPGERDRRGIVALVLAAPGLSPF